ncbi:G kinase-anchoring protein 1-like [Homarus americanus]|uniref:G kinase-anchoring protein 1-like n=1 Tax=Homarus americanus TaxID=6706 RepID=A0A8J5TIX2_HOMAM|nr:G kinase-anchoring protein 1-like [Homarus americanus]
MASRFAVLDIDVDLDERAGKKKQERAKIKSDENGKKVLNKPNNKKKKPGVADGPTLQAMAFGSNKGKNKKKPNKPGEGVDKDGVSIKTNGQVNPRVDEDWQRRDNEFIRDENERSLREALMLSKLDFEEKKVFYAKMKKEQQDETKGGKVKKKKDKPVTMSLDQFNSLRPDQLTGKHEPDQQEPQSQGDLPDEETFFEDIDEAARKTLERESRHENYKATAGQYNQEVRVSQYEAELEKRDFEIQALRLEVESLKGELKLVICSAEMKSKAELVVELEKMTKVREELTQEMSNLSAQVEQERSKVNQLSLDLKKTHGKKKQNAEAANKD